MLEVIVSVDFWKFTAPLFVGIFFWFLNEWRKRFWEQYRRKEEKYIKLIRCLRGFYKGQDDLAVPGTAEKYQFAGELKKEFLDQLNLCWLYCPDDVISKSYEFLETVKPASSLDGQGKQKSEEAMGNFVASIRKDLLPRKWLLLKSTKLSGKDFEHLGVLPEQNPKSSERDRGRR